MYKNIGVAAAIVLAGSALGGCVAYPAGPGYGGPVYAPAPAINASITIGWHGDQYWDGQRYWARNDWYARHPEARGHDDRDHGDHGDHGDRRDDHRDDRDQDNNR